MAAIEAQGIRVVPGPLRSIGWIVAALLGVLVAAYAIVLLSVPAFRPPLVANLIQSVPVLLILHLSGGAVAVATGAFQLSSRIRTRRLEWHRWLGRFYVTGAVIGGGAGLLLALRSDGGLVARIGFATLAVLWLAATIRAYVHIRNRRIEQHRAWMLRSYALTFAAVTLRLWLPLSQIAGMPFVDAYQTVAWVCWVPNLIVVEWFVLRRR